MSNQPSSQKARERNYFWANDIIDNSLPHRVLKWFRPMSFERLIKEGERLMARAEKLNRQDEARRLARESRKKACESRSKSIPKNATNLTAIAGNMDLITMLIGRILKLRK